MNQRMKKTRLNFMNQKTRDKSIRYIISMMFIQIKIIAMYNKNSAIRRLLMKKWKLKRIMIKNNKFLNNLNEKALIKVNLIIKMKIFLSRNQSLEKENPKKSNN